MKVLTDCFGKPQSPWQAIGWALVFAFVTLSLVVNHVASTVYAIFFLAGIWLLVRGRYEKPDALMNWVLIAFAAYFLVGLLSFFLGEEQTRLGEKILGRDIRFIGGVAICFVIFSLTIPARLLKGSFAVAGIVTGMAAIAEVVLADRVGYRAGGRTISIVFGHLSAALFAMNLGFLLARRAGRAVSALGMAAALIAVLLSGTRGAILAVLLIAVGAVVMWAGRSMSRWTVSLVMTGVLTLLILFSGIGERFERRIQVAVDEVEQLLREPTAGATGEWPEPPACFNDPAFLQWLVDNSLAGGKVPLQVDIKKHGSPISADGLECPSTHVITVRNTVDRGPAWLYLPRRNVPPGSVIAGRLLVMGSGVLGLGRAPAETRIRVDVDHPAVIELDGRVENDTRYLILVRPGDMLQFVPLITFQSEYQYALSNLSTAARILMWRSAVQALVEDPILGKGTGFYPAYLEERAEAGEGPWQITRFDHAHNEILNTAAERGILGLITLFGVYAAPFWLFYRRRDMFGVAGMAFVGSIFISGLTETIFNHSLGITYYSMFVLLLATAPREPLPPSIIRQKD